MGSAVLLLICLAAGEGGQARGFDFTPHETYGDPYMSRLFAAKSRGRIVMRGGFSSVQVNVDGLGNNIVGDAANEPSIAVSATDPNVIVIGWRQFDNIASNFRQAGVGYSHNGGATWTFPGVLDPGIFRSDPVLGSDTAGNIYYNSLRVAGSDYKCDTYISSDGGVTWSSPLFSLGGDKAWFTIDNTGGPANGHIYEAWSTAGNSYFPNQFSRSTNGAVNWINPVEIPPQRQTWGTLAVDLDGDLYVSGQRSGTVYVSKSTNAKLAAVTPSFDFTVAVPLGGTFTSNTGPNPGGLIGQVWIAADSSNGPTRGNIYVLSSMNPAGTDPHDVFFARSEDGGMTWSAPVRVNDDPQGSNRWQWFGTMSVAPNGRIDAVWNDTRSSLVTNLCQTYSSYSLDGGRTWSKNVSMTPTWDSVVGWPNQNKIGDYYHMASDDEGAGLAYSATFNGEQDVYFLRIEHPAPILPSSFTLFRGSLASGGLSSLFSSDDSALAVQQGIVLSNSEAPVQLVVEGTAPSGSPLELGFLIEARGSTPNLSQQIELFNFVAGAWELVDTRAATTSDSIAHVHVTSNPARFIRASDLRVMAKVSFKAVGPLLGFPFAVSFNRANWTILP
ncbi:MAG: sialidase family protein [Fimbriimonadaceae bacterium]